MFQAFPGHWQCVLSSINNIFLSEGSTIQLEGWDTSGFESNGSGWSRDPFTGVPIHCCSFPSFKKCKWNVTNQWRLLIAVKITGPSIFRHNFLHLHIQDSAIFFQVPSVPRYGWKHLLILANVFADIRQLGIKQLERLLAFMTQEDYSYQGCSPWSLLGP